MYRLKQCDAMRFAKLFAFISIYIYIYVYLPLLHIYNISISSNIMVGKIHICNNLQLLYVSYEIFGAYNEYFYIMDFKVTKLH